MKKLLSIIVIVSLFTACNRNKDTGRNILYLTDTAAFNIAADTAVVVEEPVATAPPRQNSTPRRSAPAPVYNTSTSQGTSTTANQKQGWSKAAQGAVIGGVAGAAAGAVISKDAKGAIIGGVLGAGGGYVIGRSQDRKDGRVQKKNRN